jgi:hypothetical protein
MDLPRTFLRSAASSLFLAFAACAASAQMIPNPVLVFSGQEYYATGGKQFTRYNYSVFNAEAYPAALFAAAPSLPPCGTNKNSSRTWVDVYDQRGKRLSGFCAFSGPRDLNNIWFALETTEVPPSWIYIELNDRQREVKYKSNLADTVL